MWRRENEKCISMHTDITKVYICLRWQSADNFINDHSFSLINYQCVHDNFNESHRYSFTESPVSSYSAVIVFVFCNSYFAFLFSGRWRIALKWTALKLPMEWKISYFCYLLRTDHNCQWRGHLHNRPRNQWSAES